MGMVVGAVVLFCATPFIAMSIANPPTCACRVLRYGESEA
jgi:hypothetical protein